MHIYETGRIDGHLCPFPGQASEPDVAEITESADGTPMSKTSSNPLERGLRPEPTSGLWEKPLAPGLTTSLSIPAVRCKLHQSAVLGLDFERLLLVESLARFHPVPLVATMYENANETPGGSWPRSLNKIPISIFRTVRDSTRKVQLAKTRLLLSHHHHIWTRICGIITQ